MTPSWQSDVGKCRGFSHDAGISRPLLQLHKLERHSALNSRPISPALWKLWKVSLPPGLSFSARMREGQMGEAICQTQAVSFATERIDPAGQENKNTGKKKRSLFFFTPLHFSALSWRFCFGFLCFLGFFKFLFLFYLWHMLFLTFSSMW